MNMSRKLEFVCPVCGGDRIEQVLTGGVSFTEVSLYEDPSDDVYGEPIISRADFSCFQCVKCGWGIPITDYGASADTEEDALRRWLQEQPINKMEDI